MIDRRIHIRPSISGDEKALLANMRRKDIEECKAFGMSPGRALKVSIKNSLYAKSVFLDSRIIAMIGLSGDFISDIGVPWMLTGYGIEKVPLSFAKVAIHELDKMNECKRVLTNYVMADYHEAVRFMSLVGFSLSSPRPLGKHGVLFRQITRTGV
jgi:hypothetical protein